MCAKLCPSTHPCRCCNSPPLPLQVNNHIILLPLQLLAQAPRQVGHTLARRHRPRCPVATGRAPACAARPTAVTAAKGVPPLSAPAFFLRWIQTGNCGTGCRRPSGSPTLTEVPTAGSCAGATASRGRQRLMGGTSTSHRWCAPAGSHATLAMLCHVVQAHPAPLVIAAMARLTCCLDPIGVCPAPNGLYIGCDCIVSAAAPHQR